MMVITISVIDHLTHMTWRTEQREVCLLQSLSLLFLWFSSDLCLCIIMCDLKLKSWNDQKGIWEEVQQQYQTSSDNKDRNE